MKKTLVFVLPVAMMLLGGCDMFRKLAGRPTSSDIEDIRRESLRQQAKIDSLEAAEKALKDSLAMMEAVRQSGGTVLNPSVMGGLYTTALDSRYYVVIGAFRNRANAEDLLKRVSEAGYSPLLISFRNGFNAVGLSPADDLDAALSSLRKIKEETFCPDDVWILVNE